MGVSDGQTQGNIGMSYSLPSRDLIADAVEMIVVAQAYDGNISIPGCDKNSEREFRQPRARSLILLRKCPESSWLLLDTTSRP